MDRVSRFRLAIIALAGAAIALYVLKSFGFKPILVAATAVGWRGFSSLCLYQLGQFVILGIAWYALIPAWCRARPHVFIWARMVRDASSELLPFSHLGGIVLGARAAVAHGVPQPVALGSTVTDITTEMLAQVAFTTAGVAILMTSAPDNSATHSVTSTAVFGLMSVLLGCVGFVAFQRYGLALTTKLVLRILPTVAPVTQSVVNCVREVYRRPARVALAVFCHCAGWLASALSTWIVLALMGIHARVLPVLAIESLVCAVRSIAFWMPNGLGVQEVAYATIAPIFGIGAEIGLATSLLKRARDIAVGVPTLLVWQWSESRRFVLQINGATDHRTQ